MVIVCVGRGVTMATLLAVEGDRKTKGAIFKFLKLAGHSPHKIVR